MTFLQGNRTLLEHFRLGDESALREIYLHYVSTVELFVSKGWYNPQNQYRNSGLADMEVQAEMVQETFMRAFSKKSRMAYDGVRPFRIFLLGIARNAVVDDIRKRSRDLLNHSHIPLEDADSLTSVRRKYESVEAYSTSNREETIDLERCLQATRSYIRVLNGIQKRFIYLRYKQELSILEVARRLKISRGKARYMEKDLGRRLRIHLENLKLWEHF